MLQLTRLSAGLRHVRGRLSVRSSTDSFPPIDGSLTSLANLLHYYGEAGGTAAQLLLHDGQWGGEMIDMLARYGRGLPAALIPMRCILLAGSDMTCWPGRDPGI